MAAVEVVPFAAEHLAAAGRLLADRHRLHRAAEPLLSQQFEEPDVAAAQVEALLQRGGTGALSLVDGEPTGYLVGTRKADRLWGPNVWVESAGHAVMAAETIRDLYAHAATGWAAEGREAHYVLVPASDGALVDAWFRLGFGQQHVHALQARPEARGPVGPGLTVRRAGREDIPVLAELDLELPGHQAQSPVFSAGDMPTLEDAVADWEESFDDDRFATFVVELGGHVVGSAVGCALELSGGNEGLLRPDHAGFLGFAVVRPEARGHGAGRALGEAVLAWAAEAGFSAVAADWRATNLLSSRTWPRLGFRPSFLRLHRRLGY